MRVLIDRHLNPFLPFSNPSYSGTGAAYTGGIHCGDQLKPSSIDFAGYKQEAGSEVDHSEHKTAPMWDASTAGGGSACYATALAPVA